jgi:hypothetical protein
MHGPAVRDLQDRRGRSMSEALGMFARGYV